MRIPRIYTEQPLAAGAELELEESGARHLQVLRLGAGDSVLLFNGDGRSWQAQLLEGSRKRARVAIERELEAADGESPLAIHLGIAISKGERMDWVVQKATELGVTAITPLQTQRVEVRLNAERRAKKLRHWQQVAISACEQCGRNRLPTVAEPMALQPWLGSVVAECKLVLAPGAEPLAASQPPQSLALLIGPEGGLDEAEIAAAARAGFAPLALGPRILRTETAPVAALAILQHLWGDM